MKKYWIIIALVIVGYSITHAQTNNGLIYKEIDDDFQTYYLYDSRHFDINNDSVSDFYFDTFLSGYYWAYGIWPEENWECCSYSLEEYPGVNNIFRDLDIPFNDSSLVWDGYSFSSELYPYIHCDTSTFKVGLRYRSRDDYYYGWVEAYSIYSLNSFYKLKVSRTCFCTIPNYPLRWGQTDLNENFTSENIPTAFATVHPNPTVGKVIVSGFNLKQARMFNIFGQCVATTKGEGEQFTIDISTLPTGVYFVDVTDKEGRKCVRKVVKK